jgi:phosphoenolpyruvate-protein kinase (PTS system EI component)
MGIDSLSMNPGVIPEIKRALALVELKGLAADMDKVLELEDSLEIKEAVRTYIPDTD